MLSKTFPIQDMLFVIVSLSIYICVCVDVALQFRSFFVCALLFMVVIKRKGLRHKMILPSGTGC